MINLYTSALIAPVNNLVDVEIDQIDIPNHINLRVNVSKYDSQEQLVGVIIPSTTCLENGGCTEGKTRVRVYLVEGQLQNGEKIQFKVDSL